MQDSTGDPSVGTYSTAASNNLLVIRGVVARNLWIVRYRHGASIVSPVESPSEICVICAICGFTRCCQNRSTRMTTLQDLYGLKGKVALVTGASSGLGVEFAKGMAIAGADVALVARRLDRLEEQAKAIRALGVRCLPVQADLADDAQVERAVAEVESGLGPVDVLVNNAGIADYGRGEKLSLEKWEQVVAVSLTEVIRVG